MSSNKPRGIPGLLLLVFSIAMLLVAVWSWMSRATGAAVESNPTHAASEDAAVIEVPMPR